MKRLVLIILAILYVSGCSTFMPDTTANIAKYIDAYCLAGDEVTRAAIRDDLNRITKIGDVTIICEGDAE